MSWSAVTVAGADEQPDRTERRVDAVTGSIQMTATFSVESETSTRPSTRVSGAVSTSTVVAVPTERWLVAMSPLLSTRNAELRVVGLHRRTTLFWYGASASDEASALTDADGEAGLVDALIGTTSAFFDVRSST